MQKGRGKTPAAILTGHSSGNQGEGGKMKVMVIKENGRKVETTPADVLERMKYDYNIIDRVELIEVCECGRETALAPCKECLKEQLKEVKP